MLHFIPIQILTVDLLKQWLEIIVCEQTGSISLLLSTTLWCWLYFHIIKGFLHKVTINF